MKVTFGFEKVPPAVQKTYLGCYTMVDDDWQQEYSLGVTQSPAGECSDKCAGVFTHMALSWRDQCYCANDFSDMAETDTGVDSCGVDSTGADDGSKCADGDMRTCEQVVAVSSLETATALGKHLDFFRLYLSLEKSTDGFTLGVDSTLLTVMDGQELFWLLKASVMYPGSGGKPTIRLQGDLLTEWKNICDTGIDLNAARVYVAFKPLPAPPYLLLLYFRIAADVVLPDPDRRAGSETSSVARIAAEVVLDKEDKMNVGQLMKADITNANFYTVAEIV